MKFLFSILFLTSVIFLNAQTITCVNTDTNPNNIFIAFEPPAAPCGPFQSYEIWGSTDASGGFVQIDVITDETLDNYVHINAFNQGDPWFYYIIFNYNCPGEPPVISETATNAFNNHQPEIIRLDVTEEGIVVEWDTSEFAQTNGYVISYLLPNGLSQPLDTIFGINNTTYLDENSQPLDPDLAYTLTLIDACNSQSSFNSIGYRLLVPSPPEQDDCNQLIEYQWINYVNPYDVDFSYNIYVAINENDFELVANQEEGLNIFNLFDFVNEDSVSFYVEVVDENGFVRSNSPLITVIADIVQPPINFYIWELTVTDDNNIDVTFYIDTFALLRNMTLQNSRLGFEYERVERYDAALYPDLGDIEVTDVTSDPNNDPFYYRIIATNICNQDFPSTIGRTIWVNVELEDFFLNKVNWNAFELEYAEILTYRLYRDFGNGLQLIGTYSPNDNFTELDGVKTFIDERGVFCYKVEADYEFTFPLDSSTQILTTQSNTFCIDSRPSVYIPNAIVPEGQNNIFRPLIVFGDPVNYKMMIFNRWGEQIFESNEYETGWNGTKNGKVVPMGGYPYVISFISLDGTPVERKGIVTVIR